MSRSNLPQFGIAMAIGAAIGIAIFASQDGADPVEGGGGVAAPELVGDFVGQTPPGGTPAIFAPGLITTGIYTRDVAMTPDGSELYFGVLLGPVAAIIETHRGADGVWTEPEVAPFSTDSRFFNLGLHRELPDDARDRERRDLLGGCVIHRGTEARGVLGISSEHPRFADTVQVADPPGTRTGSGSGRPRWRPRRL